MDRLVDLILPGRSDSIRVDVGHVPAVGDVVLVSASRPNGIGANARPYRVTGREWDYFADGPPNCRLTGEPIEE